MFWRWYSCLPTFQYRFYCIYEYFVMICWVKFHYFMHEMFLQSMNIRRKKYLLSDRWKTSKMIIILNDIAFFYHALPSNQAPCKQTDFDVTLSGGDCHSFTALPTCHLLVLLRHLTAVYCNPMADQSHHFFLSPRRCATHRNWKREKTWRCMGFCEQLGNLDPPTIFSLFLAPTKMATKNVSDWGCWTHTVFFSEVWWVSDS
jgi:hypothetical protein